MRHAINLVDDRNTMVILSQSRLAVGSDVVPGIRIKCHAAAAAYDYYYHWRQCYDHQKVRIRVAILCHRRSRDLPDVFVRIVGSVATIRSVAVERMRGAGDGLPWLLYTVRTTLDAFVRSMRDHTPTINLAIIYFVRDGWRIKLFNIIRSRVFGLCLCLPNFKLPTLKFSSGSNILRVASLPLGVLGEIPQATKQGQVDSIFVLFMIYIFYTHDMQKDQNISHQTRVKKDYKKSVTTEVALVVRNLLKIFRSEYFTIVLLFPIAPCRHDNFPVAFL